MLIQDFNTGSKLNEQDRILGSAFVDKGKYKTKNFLLKDILSHIRAGLPKESGSFSVQTVTQQEIDAAVTPSELINQNENDYTVPEYAITFVNMIKNAQGACDEIYLFGRNSLTFGVNSNQSTDADFILINKNSLSDIDIAIQNEHPFLGLSANDSQAEFNQAIYDLLKSQSDQLEQGSSFSVNNNQKGTVVWVDTAGANISIFIPTLIKAGFRAKYVQVGTGTVVVTMQNEDNIVSPKGLTIGGDGESIEIIKRTTDNKIYIV